MAARFSILVGRLPMDRGAWQATVHRVTKSWTQLKQLSMYVGTQTIFKSLSSLRKKKDKI